MCFLGDSPFTFTSVRLILLFALCFYLIPYFSSSFPLSPTPNCVHANYSHQNPEKNGLLCTQWDHLSTYTTRWSLVIVEAHLTPFSSFIHRDGEASEAQTGEARGTMQADQVHQTGDPTHVSRLQTGQYPRTPSGSLVTRKCLAMIISNQQVLLPDANLYNTSINHWNKAEEKRDMDVVVCDVFVFFCIFFFIVVSC